MKKIVSLLFIATFLVSFSLRAQAAPPEKMGKASYIVGGVLGIIPGFGIGHIVQGRYVERGWVFTLAEGLGAGAIVGGVVWGVVGGAFAVSQGNAGGVLGAAIGAIALIAAGGLVFTGFKIWEIVDIWGAPVWQNRLASYNPNTLVALGQADLLPVSQASNVAMLGLTWHW